MSLAKPVVGLMRRAIDAVRAANPNIDITVCGQQAEDAQSILICRELGIDAVSIPASEQHINPCRIFSGQAALKFPKKNNVL